MNRCDTTKGIGYHYLIFFKKKKSNVLVMLSFLGLPATCRTLDVFFFFISGIWTGESLKNDTLPD